MSKRDTRQHLIDTGIGLFLEHGYHDTGLQDILLAASVPKGSFYHHFQSKEGFALAVVNQYGDNTRQYLEELLTDRSRPALSRVRRFFEEVFTEFENRGCRHGCLLGNLGQELADAHEEIRRSILDHLERWADAIALCLKEAMAEGALQPNTDPPIMARILIENFQGATLKMKLERSNAPLKRFLQYHFPAPNPKFG